jgi:hypothetical protein
MPRAMLRKPRIVSNPAVERRFSLDGRLSMRRTEVPMEAKTESLKRCIKRESLVKASMALIELTILPPSRDFHRGPMQSFTPSPGCLGSIPVLCPVSRTLVRTLTLPYIQIFSARIADAQITLDEHWVLANRAFSFGAPRDGIDLQPDRNSQTKRDRS